MRVVGIDPSLQSSGICWDVDGQTVTRALTTKRKGVDRLIDIRNLVLDVVLEPSFADLVVIEGYSYGSPAMGTHAHSLGELGGVLRVTLHEHCVPVAVVAPASVKKFMCDAGNATKARVLTSAVKVSGIAFETTDECEAWVLREIGCHRYGLPSAVPPAAFRSVVLGRVDWPELEVTAA